MSFASAPRVATPSPCAAQAAPRLLRRGLWQLLALLLALLLAVLQALLLKLVLQQPLELLL